VQIVQVNNELVFVELGRHAEGREPLERERLSQGDCLRRWNRILPVREFEIEQGQCLRTDVGAVCRHRDSALCAGQPAKQFAQRRPRAVTGEGRREEAAYSATADAIELAHALIREEKQQLVFLDGAAERAAELILLEHAFRLASLVAE